jgi:hypothetical protein
MTAQTGRTPPQYIKVQIEDSGGTLRDIEVTSIDGVGITHDEVDLSALQDLVKGILPGQGNFGVTLSGPFSNKAAAAASGSGAAPTTSGSLTVLEPLNGGSTPRAFAVYYGIQHNWETGEPVFGADNCVVVSGWTVGSNGMYSCTVKHAAGGTAPDWGTSAITVA